MAVAPVVPTGDGTLSDLPFQQATTDYGTVQRDENLSGGAVTPGSDPTTYPDAIVVANAFDGTGRALGTAVGSNRHTVTVARGALAFSVSTMEARQSILPVGDAGSGIDDDHGAFANAVVHCA